MASGIIPPLAVKDRYDNPEHYEFLHGQWQRKPSVGRREHSAMGRAIYGLLRPIATNLCCRVEQEWTVVHDEQKIIPDVTFSHPNPVIKNGYLVAPALLVVESRSSGQSLQSLVDKCILEHHPMGTRYCWIVDIDARVAYECHAGDRQARRSEHLSAGELFSISTEELLASFDLAME